jgi:hypothetical protein
MEEVDVFPATSRATAERVYDPFATAPVFQEVVYGGRSTSLPRALPLSRNWTPATATLSAAFAATDIVFATLAPFIGEVIETVGGVASVTVFETVTVTEAVEEFPAASRTVAESMCEPFEASDEFQLRR